MTEETEAAVIGDFAVRAEGKPQVVEADGRKFLVVPEGMTHHEVTREHTLPKPEPKFIEQHVTLQSTDALVEYVNRFKGAETLLFADYADSKIVAVVDYHAREKAALGKHRASLQLPFSEEWKIWTKIDGQLMKQLDFARFIEENGADIKAPPAGEVLDAVRDLQARRNVNFIKAVRTSSDNESFEYTDETEARTRGELEVPTRFVLGLPVYFGDPYTELHAFLRWKLEEANLMLGIKLSRAEFVRQARFKQIVLEIADRTSTLAIFGKPV